ncbi:hypothetical protein QQ045_012547 [Rhodiola kirilowii]
MGDLDVKARLDRAFGNEEWKSLYPNYEVRHLISSVSDHLPIMVDFCKKKRTSRTKLFRFEPP